MIDLVLILSLTFIGAVFIMMLISIRKSVIEMRKQITEMEFARIKN